VATLRAYGAEVRYLTNNSTQLRETYVQKLERMGFEVRPEWVYSSAMGAAQLLKGTLTRAFVVGEEGIVSALGHVGIKVHEDPEAVVVGMCRHFDYDLLNEALQFLLNPEVRFVATNRDATYPLEGGRVVPGAGSIVAAIATASGREPEVVGKPSPFLIEWILNDAGILPEDVLVVGDRLDTDIEAGVRARCPVHLVLSGVTVEAPSGVSASLDLSALVA
jgi:4-nitrophenyl phosphatase